MNRDRAIKIIHEYFESWTSKDIDLFNQNLHDGAVVRECNGAVIQGRDDCLIFEINEYEMKQEKFYPYRSM